MGRLHLHLVGDPDLVEPVRRERGEEYDQDLRDSPFLYLLNAAGTRDLPLRLRRRLAGCGRNAIFQFSRSWRSRGRLTISPN
jgi:hypothetical protein